MNPSKKHFIITTTIIILTLTILTTGVTATTNWNITYCHDGTCEELIEPGTGTGNGNITGHGLNNYYCMWNGTDTIENASISEPSSLILLHKPLRMYLSSGSPAGDVGSLYFDSATDKLYQWDQFVVGDYTPIATENYVNTQITSSAQWIDQGSYIEPSSGSDAVNISGGNELIYNNAEVCTYNNENCALFILNGTDIHTKTPNQALTIGNATGTVSSEIEIRSNDTTAYISLFSSTCNHESNSGGTFGMNNDYMVFSNRETGGPIQFCVEDGTHCMNYISTGRLGIGDASPDSLLDIYRASAHNYYFVDADAGYNTGISMLLAGTNKAYLYYDASGGYINIRGESGVPLRLWTDATQQAVLDTTGKLGIGDLTPDGFLDIQIDNASEEGLIIQATAGQTENLIELHNSGGSILNSFTADGFMSTATGSGTDNIIRVRNTALQEILTVEADYDIGLGTQNPTSRIDIIGEPAQTKNFITIQDNTSTILTSIQSDGSLNLTQTGQVIHFSNGCYMLSNATGVYTIC